MPLPTPKAEIYIGQSTGVSVTLGGVACDVISGTYSVESMTDEMTNTGSGGWYESVGTIQKATGNFMLAWRASAPPQWAQGLVYELIIDNSNANYFEGDVRVLKIDYPGANPKEGVKVTINWESQGQCSTDRP